MAGQSAQEPNESQLKQVAGYIKSCRRLVVLTGAGVSKESGIPTFRDKLTGLWEGYDPTQLATPEGFLKDPPLVWKWYDWRRGIVSKAEPNAGHRAIAELEKEWTLWSSPKM